MRLLQSTLLMLSLLTIAAAPLHAAAPAATIGAEALRDDIDFLRRTVREAHPDLGFSTSLAALDAALEEIRRDLPPRMTTDDAWQRLARINPVLADGHLFVGLPDWRAGTAAHQAAGGTLFPYEIALDDGGRVFVAAALGGAPTALAGARIVAIDGVAAQEAGAAMLARVHGDTPAFRRALLARRWWLYHWKLHGAPPEYRLELERDGRRWNVTVEGSAQQPAVLRDERDLASPYRLEMLPGCTAVLTAASFDGGHHGRFVAFTRDAFARLRAANVETLVIDVSANGGGDDALWLDGLLPYLAGGPYRTGSAYVKRVLTANPARNEAVGQIVHGEIDTWRQPQPDNPLRFSGTVKVLVGPSTYSSAILFANVMRDFGFGTLVGSGGAARRGQSGGVRKWILPHSGLELWAPRFILAPPDGGDRGALLQAQAGWDRTVPGACRSQPSR